MEQQKKCSIYDDAVEEEKYEWVEKRPPVEQLTKPKVNSNWIPPVMKKMYEMTDEELWSYCPESENGQVSIDTVKDKSFDGLREYYKKLLDSQGFDIDENPGFGVCSVFKVEVCEKSHPEEYYKTYMTLAQFAIDETYNKDKKTDLKVLEMKTVNRTYNRASGYLMTFTAAGSYQEADKTFQASVATWNNNQKVMKCRLKAQ